MQTNDTAPASMTGHHKALVALQDALSSVLTEFEGRLDGMTPDPSEAKAIQAAYTALELAETESVKSAFLQPANKPHTAMHPKNTERARRIWSQIQHYPDGFDFRVLADIYTEEHVRASVEEDAIRDVLTDLMHLCDLSPDIPFEEMQALARANYVQERDNDGESCMFLAGEEG